MTERKVYFSVWSWSALRDIWAWRFRHSRFGRYSHKQTSPCKCDYRDAAGTASRPTREDMAHHGGEWELDMVWGPEGWRVRDA